MLKRTRQGLSSLGSLMKLMKLMYLMNLMELMTLMNSIDARTGAHLAFRLVDHTLGFTFRLIGVSLGFGGGTTVPSEHVVTQPGEGYGSSGIEEGVWCELQGV